MDVALLWQGRLAGAGIRPAHGGPLCSVWLDRFNRTIQIDWNAQRFVYQCAEADRPPAFTPGKSYPLSLLFSDGAEAVEQPQADTARRWCPDCEASTDQERLSEIAWWCHACKNVSGDLTAPKPRPEGTKSRKPKAKLTQLELFG